MKRLSASEWELMLICWDLGPATARRVHEASLQRKPRAYRTILATLRNIAAKGHLAIEKRPGPKNIPTNVFRPRVSRRRGVERRISDFLERDLGWRPEDLGRVLELIEERDPRGGGGRRRRRSE